MDEPPRRAVATEDVAARIKYLRQRPDLHRYDPATNTCPECAGHPAGR